jgi:spore coat polysaccharide biosynthesis protein SpsF
MTSSRLPGKVLMLACGKPMLELMIERVARMDFVDEIVVATTTNDDDQPIVDMCAPLGVQVYRGSEDDVMGRVLAAVRSVEADVIVELTGDCPLIDPGIASQVLEFFLIHDFDYVSNNHIRWGGSLTYDSYPVGMDTEVFTVDTLARSESETQHPLDREHVSLHIIRSERFTQAIIPAPTDLRWPDLGLTLDERHDYELIRQIFEALYRENPAFSLSNVLDYLRANPKLVEINMHVERPYPVVGVDI